MTVIFVKPEVNLKSTEVSIIHQWLYLIQNKIRLQKTKQLSARVKLVAYGLRLNIIAILFLMVLLFYSWAASEMGQWTEFERCSALFRTNVGSIMLSEFVPSWVA